MCGVVRTHILAAVLLLQVALSKHRFSSPSCQHALLTLGDVASHILGGAQRTLCHPQGRVRVGHAVGCNHRCWHDDHLSWLCCWWIHLHCFLQQLPAIVRVPPDRVCGSNMTCGWVVVVVRAPDAIRCCCLADYVAMLM